MPNSLELNVSPAQLHTFANHPFHVRKDMEMNELVDSIRESGVIVPLIVRTRPEGGYEIISGHRRCEACRELGIEKVPVRVQELTDDEATILMVNSNIQREHVLPSEKAFAYKMKMDAMKRTLGRVYIIFTTEEIMDALSCANQKACRLMLELENDAGLIERKRQGLGKPSLIYVKNFAVSS